MLASGGMDQSDGDISGCGGGGVDNRGSSRVGFGGGPGVTVVSSSLGIGGSGSADIRQFNDDDKNGGIGGRMDRLDGHVPRTERMPEHYPGSVGSGGMASNANLSISTSPLPRAGASDHRTFTSPRSFTDYPTTTSPLPLATSPRPASQVSASNYPLTSTLLNNSNNSVVNNPIATATNSSNPLSSDPTFRTSEYIPHPPRPPTAREDDDANTHCDNSYVLTRRSHRVVNRSATADEPFTPASQPHASI